MQSLPDERKRLDLIDGTLRADAPLLAAKFDMFTQLTRGDGNPPAERQLRTSGDWRYKAFARRRARRYWITLTILFLVALALVLATALS